MNFLSRDITAISTGFISASRKYFSLSFLLWSIKLLTLALSSFSLNGFIKERDEKIRSLDFEINEKVQRIQNLENSEKLLIKTQAQNQTLKTDLEMAKREIQSHIKDKETITKDKDAILKEKDAIWEARAYFAGSELSRFG